MEGWTTDLGWSFLREDAYELVFTSDNPVVARSF